MPSRGPSRIRCSQQPPELLYDFPGFSGLGYAISMGNVVQNPGREFRFTFPLILSAVALLLSFRAQPGITGACKVIAEWHLKQEKLFLSGTVLDDYSVLRRVDITESHEKNLWFAQTAPWIFGSAWILMAILAVYLHGQP